MLGVHALLGLSLDAQDLAAYDEAHDIDVVRGEVEHDSDVADALREGADAAGVHLEHAAEVARLNALLEGDDRRVETLDVADRQRDARGRGGIAQALALFEGGGEGLFDEQRDAALDDAQRDVEVGARRDGDGHEVRALLIEQAREVGVPADGAAARGVLDPRGVGIGDGGELDAREVGVDAGVIGAHCAEADDGGAEGSVWHRG